MRVFSVRAACRVAVCAVPLIACAEGTQGDMGANLMQGGSAGDMAAGGSSGATAGETSVAGSGGSGVIPVAGSATTGGGGMAAGMGGGGMGGGGMGGVGGAGGGGGGMGGGGMGGKAGAGGTGGAASTGYRYVRFQALSEQTGKVWSSCAELNVFTTGDVAIPRTGWTVMADSQETDNEQVPAINAIDGNQDTFWHTSWEPPPDDVNDAALPHQLVIDLGSAKVITGFSYLPRQVGENGRVKDYAFFVSTTNGNWGTAVKTGSFPAGTTLQKITF